MPKVLMIVGSLREKSFNRQLAGEVERLVGEHAEVSYLDYADIPYMNQDAEFPAPDAVARVRAEVQAVDGIWICSPEYNYNIPGVLKNLLDWLSRPLVANDWSAGSAVGGKAVTVSGCGGKNATADMRRNLAKLLADMRMEVVGGEGTGIVLDGSAFATDVATFADEDIERLSEQVDAFMAALA